MHDTDTNTNIADGAELTPGLSQATWSNAHFKGAATLPNDVTAWGNPHLPARPPNGS